MPHVNTRKTIILNNLVKTYMCQTMPQATSNNQVIFNEMCHDLKLSKVDMLVILNMTHVTPWS
jgi:hypothetical protein